MTYLEGEILVSCEGADHKLRVETVAAGSAQLGEAGEDATPWFDVLDARDGDTAMYTHLFDSHRSGYSECVESDGSDKAASVIV